MTALLCPLCSKSRFENLETLRGRLVQAATQNITCPICLEVLLGLDKFTIHLFGHTLPEATPAAPDPSTQCTVNMDDLSFLTSWENCWKQNQETPKPESKPKEVINELFLEIKSEESCLSDKRSSIKQLPTNNSTMDTNLFQKISDPNYSQQVEQPKNQFGEMREQISPTLDSPPFLFDGENSLILTPSPKTEDNDTSQEGQNTQEVRELSQYMAGLLSLENVSQEQQKKSQYLNSTGPGKQQTAQFLKQQAAIMEPKQNWEQCINSSREVQKIKEDSVILSAQTSPVRNPEEATKQRSFPFQFLVFQGQSLQQTASAPTKEPNLRPKQETHFCNECGKSFRMRGSLVVHYRVAHAGKTLETTPEPRNHHCSICSKAFKKEQHLSQHIKTHDGKQWQCETCAKFFTTKYFLKKHQRLHTGEMPYCCETCGKTFTFQQSYHKHLLYHSADKPHECRECGRSFKELSTLHNHQRIHSGEKPFACETCGKCFRQRVSYIVHQRIHTGVLPYQCTACSKKFRYKVSQRSHKCTAQPPGIVVRQPGDLIQRLLEQRRLLQCPQ